MSLALPATMDLKAASVMAGPRFSHRTEKVRLFAHALFGVQRVSTTIAFLQNPITEMQTHGLAAAIGGGFEFVILEDVMIRPVQLDYLESAAQRAVSPVGKRARAALSGSCSGSDPKGDRDSAASLLI